MYKNNVTDYEVLIGQPDYSLKKIDSEELWEFSYRGYVVYDKEPFDSYNYCLDKSERSSKTGWDLSVCRNNRKIEEIIYIGTSVMSSIFLLATILVYAFVRELRTVSGICTIFFVTGLLVTQLSTALIHVGLHRYYETLNFIAGFGVLFSFLWMNILSFDIYWTFRRFRDLSEENQRLKFYCYYAFGTTCLVYLLVQMYFVTASNIIEKLLYACYAVFFLMAIFDILFLILAAIKIFRLSKVSTSSESSRYSAEKDRFWAYVELHALMLVFWPFEITTTFTFKAYNMKIVSDFIKCFSYFLVFVIFVLRKNVWTVIKANR